MKFQVYRKNAVLMQTEDERFLPTAEQIKTMKAAGLTFRMNGKAISANALNFDSNERTTQDEKLHGNKSKSRQKQNNKARGAI